MKLFPVIRKLPAEYLEGIGAICFEWSLLERELAVVTYMLLRLDPKRGRIAVRSPRANERLTMIRQLMSLEKDIKVENADLDELAKALTTLETQRDQIAHGTYLQGVDGEILLQSLGGNWKPDPKLPKVSRRIKPEGVLLTAGDMKEMAKLMAACTLIVYKIGLEIEAALGSSPNKSPPQSEWDRPQDDPSSNTSEPPPQASSA